MRLKTRTRKRQKRRIPQLNTTATADISFMLLIFFLVTSSMDSDKGIRRQLPPKDNEKEVQAIDVDRNDVLTIVLNSQGQVKINDSIVVEEQIPAKLTNFIKKVGKKHILELQASKSATYDQYFRLQNKIVNNYNRLYNETALERYNIPYAKCSAEQRKTIKEMYPQHISEQFVSPTFEQVNGDKQ